MNYQKKIFLKYVGFAVCAVAFVKYVNFAEHKIIQLEFVLNSLISFSTTISGFIMATLSILIGMSNNPLIVEIRKNNLIGEIKWRFSETIISGLALIAICIVFGAITPEDLIIPGNWIEAICCIVSWYFLSVITTCYYLVGILAGTVTGKKNKLDKNPSEPEGEFRK